MDFSGSIAIVFGNEQNGCSPEILSKCDGKIFIPQVGMVKSLNISVACAVILYEAFRQKEAAGHYDTPSLPEKVRNDLLTEWTDFSNIRKLKNRKP
jgi:tRNA (guanosine-2'-O-)-methyltransferase